MPGLGIASLGRSVAGRGVAAALLLSAASGWAQTPPKRVQALHFYEQAVELRQGLEKGEPSAQDFLNTIQIFRRVYTTAPASSKADDSLLAEGELYAEMAKRFGGQSYAKKAADAYEFLMREYPTSPLLAEAREKLAALGATALAKVETPPARPAVAEGVPAASEGASQGLPQVTDVRFWSSPGLTRVVVDVQADINPHGDRLRNPDRVYFDLPKTKMGAALKGKSFEVSDALAKRIRVAQTQLDVTRVVVDLNADAVDYTLATLANPPRVVLELRERGSRATATLPQVPPAPVPAARAAVSVPAPVVETKLPLAPAVKAALAPAMTPTAAPPPTPTTMTRLTVPAPAADAKLPPAPVVKKEKAEKVQKAEVAAPVAAPEPPAAPRVTAKAAAANSRGERSLTRALGLKVARVVIDAGHGGHDTGTIGPTGLMEKELTLDLAHRLGELVSDRLSSEVIYTRDDDTFIALEERTAIANEKQADLFISIHANSSRVKTARGVETYYLNFTADAEALEVAARENAASEKSVHDLQDLVKKITLTDKVNESREFALQVQRSLHRTASKDNAALRNRGVRKAPFVVLIGAQMPSVLAEVTFLSNPRDEKLLKGQEARQKLAEALFDGVAAYAQSLSRVEVAAK